MVLTGLDDDRAQHGERWGARAVLLVPYLWLALFFLVPFLIVFKISLSQTAIAQPPYVPVLDLAAGWQGLQAFLRAAVARQLPAARLATRLYLLSYLKSLEVAARLDRDPAADRLSDRLRHRARAAPPAAVLVMLVVLPFWTSFLIRIYAWINILQRDGLLNEVLLALGIIDAPLAWLSTDTAVYIGIVYSYLPFMVLPLYATLEKMDETLLEAAADLGCPRWKAFWLVTLPLSLPGIAAGALLCFIPIVGEFVIPDLLGGSRSADDRPDAVDRVLLQPGLAGGLRDRGRAAGAPGACRSCSTSACRRAQLEGLR